MYISDRKNYQKLIINILISSIKMLQCFQQIMAQTLVFPKYIIFEILKDLYQFTRTIFNKLSLNADYDSC